MASNPTSTLRRLPTLAWLAGLAFAGGALLGGFDADTGTVTTAAAADPVVTSTPSPAASVATGDNPTAPAPEPTATDVPSPAPSAPSAKASPPVTAPQAKPQPTVPVQGRLTTLIKLQRTRLGNVVADDRGHTAYFYDRDQRQPSHSVCYGKCARTWLPLLVDDSTAAAKGLDLTRFGLVERKDGATQLTYKGWPLYVYVRDRHAGSLNGNDGPGGTWHAAAVH
jgi:predicted lipoprotein with Yx(FWY)xxD motif